MKNKPIFTLIALVVLVSLFLGTISASQAQATVDDFSVLLGRPTDESILANIIPDEDGDLYIQYGTTSGSYSGQTSTVTVTAGEPVELVLSGLAASTEYFYRIRFMADGSSTWVSGTEASFDTQKAPGESFVFTIISDSHLGQYGGQTTDELALYEQTLLNVGADHPDFHIDLGDSSAMDPSPLGTGMTVAEAAAAYYIQRPYLDNITDSIPFYLVLGNHENEEGWNFDDTFTAPDQSLAIVGMQARKKYFPNPINDDFYSANVDPLSQAIGGDTNHEDYYAWVWGDALFVVLDPYHYSMVWPAEDGTYGGEGEDGEVGGDRWDWSLGIEQYLWLKDILENSDATYKFVFAHHVTGGSTPYGRGGIGAAPYFEWGGYNADDSWGWDVERPAAEGWDVPVHQLMAENGVDVFFHGHDHIYAYETLDNIAYLEVPKPDDAGYTWEPYGYGYNEDLYPDGLMLTNSGHIRVTVEPDETTVEYVRAYLPGDGVNGVVAHSFTVPAGPKHTITTDAGDHGSISPTHYVLVGENDDQAFTITAESGYQISDVLVDDVSVGAVSSYTFTDVTADHTIEAVFGFAGASGTHLYRVNNGGPDIDMSAVGEDDFLGLTQGDLDAIPGLTASGDFQSDPSTTGTIDMSGVDPNLPEALFQTANRTSVGSGSLNFAFEVPNGQYTVLLHFSEQNSSYTEIGDRVFDIYVEGDQVLPNYDMAVVTDEAGINVAITEAITNVTVDDGELLVTVTADVSVAIIRGIEIMLDEVSLPTHTLLLGRPTDNSVTVNAVLDQSGQVSFEYGTTSGSYTTQTSAFTATVDEPVETVFSGLSSDTQYFYRMRYRATSGDEWLNGTEHSFQTQRVRGESFTFTVSSDSHLGDTFSGIDPDRYEATTVNIANDDPDFHLDLGDAFVMNSPTNQDQADEIYLAQRPFFGNFSHSAPVFLAIGNHENEEGWNLDDTPFSKALGSITARKKYFLNPVTDAFYSGNDDPLPTAYGGGYREDYYAWEWGDALFVVLDPFQYTMTKPYENDPFNENETETGDQWDWTLGIDQYMWFKETLENSTAPYKFVFAHHMLGGVPYLSVGGADAGYVRGGAEAAPYFEWGGQNEDDTYGFTVERPSVTWGADPIHQIMLDNNVTIFFHGHDHQFVHEIRDGITYQEVPSSSMTGYGFDLYDDSPYAVSGGNLPNAGHLRIDVTADLATVRYVRAAIAGDTGITNGSVSYTYTVTPSVAGERLNGDANRDSSINSTDALVILSYDVGLDVPYTIDACSDINGDGFVNSTDALAILSNDAGITVPFPIGGICTLPQG